MRFIDALILFLLPKEMREYARRAAKHPPGKKNRPPARNRGTAKKGASNHPAHTTAGPGGMQDDASTGKEVRL